MSTRTTYTTTITIPVYASWKCEHCGEVNLAFGVIRCQRQSSTTSLRQSRLKEARSTASDLAEAAWKEDAFKIISDPNHHGSLMYSNLFFPNTNCTRCNKKPRWNKNVKFLPLVGIAMIVGLISGICAFSMLTDISAWLVFLWCVGFIAWGIVREELYKKIMKTLPQCYTPVLGTLNPEMIEYGNNHSKPVLSPDECIGFVKSLNRIAQPIEDKSSTDYIIVPNSSHAVPCNFCRKCGTQLQSESDFCHKCGAATMK